MPLGDVLSVAEIHSRSVEDNFASQDAFLLECNRLIKTFFYRAIFPNGNKKEQFSTQFPVEP